MTPEFLIGNITLFVLAIFLGFELITKVPATLHTPLMSGANAISGISIIGALIGSRALYVFTEWGEFSDKSVSEWINFRSGGLVFYGGFIGGAIAVILYILIQGSQPLWKIADALAPSIPLGHALGRLGCLMYGCCFGATCDFPWAVQFPFGSPAHSVHNSAGLLTVNASHSLHVHPSQIYAALLNFLIYT